MNAYHFTHYSNSSQRGKKRAARDCRLVQAECTRRGWTYNTDTTFFGAAGSGLFPKGSFNRFLQAAEHGQLLPRPVLVLLDLASLPPNAAQSPNSKLWALVDYGVSVLFLPANLLLVPGSQNQIQNRILLQYEFFRAHQESQRKVNVIKEAYQSKLNKAADGIPVKWGSWLPTWIKFVSEPERPNHFELEPTRAQVIRRIVHLRLDHHLKFTSIARMLNNEQAPTLRGGKSWTAPGIKRLLANPALIGTATIAGQTFTDYYPAIITRDKWIRIQGSQTSALPNVKAEAHRTVVRA